MAAEDPYLLGSTPWRRTITGRSGEYEVVYTGRVLSCSCPGWRYQHKNNTERVCRHLEEHYPHYQPLHLDWSDQPPALMQFPSFDRHKHHVDGWWWSEKLNGILAFWDGERLLSRRGQVLSTPWKLPPHLQLTGELWAGRRGFETTLQTLYATAEDPVWSRVQFHVFDTPQYPEETYEDRWQRVLETAHEACWEFQPVDQHRLRSVENLDLRVRQLTREGAEGVVLRNPQSLYITGRHIKVAVKWKVLERGTATALTRAGHRSWCVRILTPTNAQGQELQLSLPPHDPEGREGQTLAFVFWGLTTSGKPKHAQFEEWLTTHPAATIESQPRGEKP